MPRPLMDGEEDNPLEDWLNRFGGGGNSGGSSGSGGNTGGSSGSSSGAGGQSNTGSGSGLGGGGSSQTIYITPPSHEPMDPELQFSLTPEPDYGPLGNLLQGYVSWQDEFTLFNWMNELNNQNWQNSSWAIPDSMEGVPAHGSLGWQSSSSTQSLLDSEPYRDLLTQQIIQGQNAINQTHPLIDGVPRQGSLGWQSPEPPDENDFRGMIVGVQPERSQIPTSFNQLPLTETEAYQQLMAAEQKYNLHGQSFQDFIHQQSPYYTDEELAEIRRMSYFDENGVEQFYRIEGNHVPDFILEMTPPTIEEPPAPPDDDEDEGEDWEYIPRYYGGSGGGTSKKVVDWVANMISWKL